MLVRGWRVAGRPRCRQPATTCACPGMPETAACLPRPDRAFRPEYGEPAGQAVEMARGTFGLLSDHLRPPPRSPFTSAQPPTCPASAAPLPQAPRRARPAPSPTPWEPLQGPGPEPKEPPRSCLVHATAAPHRSMMSRALCRSWDCPRICTSETIRRRISPYAGSRRVLRRAGALHGHWSAVLPHPPLPLASPWR